MDPQNVRLAAAHLSRATLTSLATSYPMGPLAVLRVAIDAVESTLQLAKQDPEAAAAIADVFADTRLYADPDSLPLIEQAATFIASIARHGEEASLDHADRLVDTVGAVRDRLLGETH